jgi:DNA-binding transcriptional MerR regulator
MPRTGSENSHDADGADHADRANLLQIGEVADQVGLSLRTIRHYEEVGVIAPSTRTDGGYRLYSDRDVERLRKVMGMKPMGFTLEEIRDLLDLLDAADGPVVPESVQDRLTMYAALATERRDKYRRKLELANDFTSMLQERVQQSSDRPTDRLSD